jgi:hypothetical protein
MEAILKDLGNDKAPAVGKPQSILRRRVGCLEQNGAGEPHAPVVEHRFNFRRKAAPQLTAANPLSGL